MAPTHSGSLGLHQKPCFLLELCLLCVLCCETSGCGCAVGVSMVLLFCLGKLVKAIVILSNVVLYPFKPTPKICNLTFNLNSPDLTKTLFPSSTIAILITISPNASPTPTSFIVNHIVSAVAAASPFSSHCRDFRASQASSWQHSNPSVYRRFT